MKKVLALCLIISLGLSPFRSFAAAEEGGVWGGAPQRRVQHPLAERAEQIALEFYNYRCTAYEGGHFVEQTDENRANVIARVKRYFRNSKNWEHIKRLDIDHFANEVMGASKIPRSSFARAELETFLKDQIEKLPEIEAPLPAPTVWQRIKANSVVDFFFVKHKKKSIAVLVGAIALVARIAWARGRGAGGDRATDARQLEDVEQQDGHEPQQADPTGPQQPSGDIPELQQPPPDDIPELQQQPSVDIPELQLPPSVDIHEQQPPPPDDIPELQQPPPVDIHEQQQPPPPPPPDDIPELQQPPPDDIPELQLPPARELPPFMAIIVFRSVGDTGWVSLGTINRLPEMQEAIRDGNRAAAMDILRAHADGLDRPTLANIVQRYLDAMFPLGA